MDELTERWFGEIERIRLKTPDQVTIWEEALIETTLELQPTMNKIKCGVPLGEYDRFLIDILTLLVLRGSDDDRELALQKLAEAAQRAQPRVVS